MRRSLFRVSMDHLPRALAERKTTWMACLWLKGRAVLRFLVRRSPPWSRGSLGRQAENGVLVGNLSWGGGILSYSHDKKP